MSDVDDKFFDRADAHIHLSNDQVKGVSSGRVSASMMYVTARFNAWLAAYSCENSESMRELRAKNIEDFVGEYRKMLEENLDDYIANFDDYIAKGQDGA
jgi:hypothetical protein